MDSGVSSPLPQYQCHKKVWALKILAVEEHAVPVPVSREDLHKVGDVTITVDEHGDATIEEAGGRLIVEPPFSPLEVSPEFMAKHKPVAGGYYVVYENGYASFSPAKAFDEGYSLIPPGMAVPKPCCLRFYDEQIAAALA